MEPNRIVAVADRIQPVIDGLLKNVEDGASTSSAGSRLFKNAGDSTYKKVDKAGKEFNKSFNRHVKSQVADDLSFQCFRVYANTSMINKGVNIIDCQRILGQETHLVQKSYTDRDLKRYKAAVDGIY